MYCRCGVMASFICNCEAVSIFLCDQCAVEHMKSIRISHNLISYSPEEASKDLIVFKLTEAQRNINSVKKVVIEDLSNLLHSLESKGKEVLNILHSNEIFISDLVTNLKFSSSASPSNYDHSLLRIDPHQAEVLCNQFEIFNSKLNKTAVSTAIDSWVILEFNIHEFMEGLQMEANKKSDPPMQIISNKSSQIEKVKIRPASMTIRRAPSPSSYKTYSDEAPSVYNPHQSNPQTSYNTFARYDNTEFLQDPNDSFQIPSEELRSNFEGLSLTPKIVNNPSSLPLVCNNNHGLSWSNSNALIQFFNNRSYWINCNGCRTQYTTPGWSCSKCDFSLCESCGIIQGHPPPNLRCPKDHALRWRCDTSIYYQSLGRAPNYTCNFCGISDNGPNWHCRECNYDICINCGSSAKLIAPTPITCCYTHHLEYSVVMIEKPRQHRKIAIPCIKCSQQLEGKAYKCKDCPRPLCSRCRSIQLWQLPGHPVISCVAKHLLRWGDAGAFGCNLCKKTFVANRFTCRQCKFDMCSNCSYLLEDITIGNYEGKSKCGHKQTYVLVSPENWATGRIQCKQCGLMFSDEAGLLFCNTCTNYCCLGCFTGTKTYESEKPIRINPFAVLQREFKRK